MLDKPRSNHVAVWDGQSAGPQDSERPEPMHFCVSSLFAKAEALASAGGAGGAGDVIIPSRPKPAKPADPSAKRV